MAQTGSIQPDFPNFTAQENQGKRVFLNPGNACVACHLKNFNPNEPNEAVFINDRPTNNGLFLNYADNGLGKVSGNPTQNGLFKVRSLRNIMLTAP
jgi:cytochrome c peroxidase